jgi:hypothetical protein
VAEDSAARDITTPAQQATTHVAGEEFDFVFAEPQYRRTLG